MEDGFGQVSFINFTKNSLRYTINSHDITLLNREKNYDLRK